VDNQRVRKLGKQYKIGKFPVKLILWLFFLCILFTIFLLLSQNTEATTVRGHIITDTTWKASKSPYIISDTVYVNVGVNLNIEPGVVVQFDQFEYLCVDGNLNASGTEIDKIIFKSSTQNSYLYGGGISIRENGKANFEHCEISHLSTGIRIDYSSGITISDSNIHDISNNGIWAISSPDLSISRSQIWNISKYAIEISSSSNLTLTYVEFWNNTQWNLYILGNSKDHYNFNIENCRVENKPFLYYFDTYNLTIENLNLGKLILAWCDNITVKQSNFINAGGISLYYTSNSQIINCSFSYNNKGVYLYASEDNKILNSFFFSNENGIYFSISNNNNIYLCNFSANEYGISVRSYSDSNQISSCNITSNNYGIYLSESESNFIYHNNFINNTDDVEEYSGNVPKYNVWNYGNEGNYWDDYSGDDIEGDNIGDEPFRIPSYSRYVSKDYYPLIYPFEGSLPPDITPPHFTSEPFIADRTLIMPRDFFYVSFEISEQGHYEVLIETDEPDGFDNFTEIVLTGETSRKLSYVYWSGVNNESNYVADGDYKIQILIWDSKDNQIELPYDAGFINVRIDQDGDTVLDINDAFPQDPNESSDFDSDGIGDNSDPDLDNDRVENTRDAFPWNYHEWSDQDGDGIGDNSDSDDNGNNIPDSAEIPFVILILVIPFALIYYANKNAKKAKEE
jgi:parallel beta-helix repeat protein